ncbi:MAG: DMT family transporter [Bacteroidales bacterium]|nr:DMT family transporter [Bacteroidales bacterium]
MKPAQKVYILVLFAIMFWSTAAVAFKIALQYMDFIHLLFFSALSSFLVLLTILFIQNQYKELFSYSKKQYLYSLILGFLNPFAYYMVLLKAYSILPAQLAQPLNYTWPIMLVLLSALLLKQKLNIISLLAAFVSFFGVYLISLRGASFSIDIQQPVGILLATGSSVIWALFWIYNIKDKRSEIQKLTLSFFFSVFFIGFALFFFSDFQIPEFKGILAAVYTGFFEMSITYVLWLKALKLAKRSDKISNLVFISPFFSLLWIHLILGENIYNTTIYGLIFIISGIFIQQIFSKSAKA